MRLPNYGGCLIAMFHFQLSKSSSKGASALEVVVAVGVADGLLFDGASA